MNDWPKQDAISMNKFYGDPDIQDDGFPDPAYESQNLVIAKAPYPLFLSWNMKPASGIRVHKKCADSLARVLAQIGKNFSEDEINRYQLNRVGGGYNFRLKRGANSLSIHSWGAAVDLAPDLNGFGVEYTSRPNMMPQAVVKLFALEGWVWGGMWRKPDAMHFQAAKV